jgi:GTP-binding protein YchF
VDVPGGLTAQGIGEFRQVDALAMVVRAFGSDADPAAELNTLRSELILADLVSIENGLEKAKKKSKGKSDGALELTVLEKAHAQLTDEKLIRDGAFDVDELRILKGFAPLTFKPWVVVVNVEEGETSSPLDQGLAISAALEAEVADMDDAEARDLLKGFGIEEPGLDRVVAECYRALDLITFLTTGEDETRAWEVRRGARAPEAAGVIHTDLERGFIRAEVISYSDLVEAGSWNAAKTKGTLRVEGKDYEVQEGDVLNIRFAV